MAVKGYQNEVIDEVANWAWYNSAWHRTGLPFTVSDRLVEEVSNLNAAAGTNFLDGTAVPAGEIWVVTQVTFFDVTSAITAESADLIMGAVTMTIAQTLTPAVSQITTVQGQWILKEGDYVRAAFFGCTLNDDLYLRYSGYKMSVNE